MKRIVGWLVMTCLMCLVVACSDPDQGPELGPFAAITKQETDPPFNLTPPTSKSPEPFSFTSSNAAVATISGTLVTIKGPGQTTITASQPGTGAWGPTSASTTLTVNAVPCDAGSTRINGQCVPIPTCTIPATLVNNECVAPATTAVMVRVGSLAWMGVSNSDTWEKARAFCTTSKIEGSFDWRLPSQAELTALFASGAFAGSNWVLGNTWSSTMGTAGTTPGHVAVNLATGAVVERADELGAFVSCVH
jgi:hypothetical protein